MAANAQVDISASVQYTSTAGLATFTGTPRITSTTTLDPTAISKVYQASRSISTADTLNVNSGLTDPFGNALVFSTVKLVVINNTSATATITVGGGSNPLFGTDQITIKAGACVPITSAFTVDSTHKVITVTPSAAATYQIIIAGV